MITPNKYSHPVNEMDLIRGDLGSSLSPTPTYVAHDVATPRTLDNKWEVKVAVKYEGRDG